MTTLPSSSRPAPSRPLSLLVLGGTSWLGGAVARHAHERGHEVTCLARGESGSVPAGARLLVGDRDDPASAYDRVRDRSWDAVVDVARQPLHVAGAVEALAERVGHWVFVSTCSVYADDSRTGQDESAALHEPWVGEGLAPDEAYGPAKVACESLVLEAFPDALVARAGLIVGHGDRSDRFGYWPARFARAQGGEQVLVPPVDQQLQVVDVEDLALWLVVCAERGTGGVFNALGDSRPIADLVEVCQKVVGTTADVVSPADAWLQEQQVEPWMGPESLPLWLPQPAYAGFMARSNAGARAAGLSLRPLEYSVAASLAWEREQGLDRERRAGLSPQRERDLLERLVGVA